MRHDCWCVVVEGMRFESVWEIGMSVVVVSRGEVGEDALGGLEVVGAKICRA